jgi:alpha-L-fucosidase
MVTQHNNLVLNSPPDREGVMPADNRRRLIELRRAVDREQCK